MAGEPTPPSSQALTDAVTALGDAWTEYSTPKNPQVVSDALAAMSAATTSYIAAVVAAFSSGYEPPPPPPPPPPNATPWTDAPSMDSSLYKDGHAWRLPIGPTPSGCWASGSAIHINNGAQATISGPRGLWGVYSDGPGTKLDASGLYLGGDHCIRPSGTGTAWNISNSVSEVVESTAITGVHTECMQCYLGGGTINLDKMMFILPNGVMRSGAIYGATTNKQLYTTAFLWLDQWAGTVTVTKSHFYGTGWWFPFRARTGGTIILQDCRLPSGWYSKPSNQRFAPDGGSVQVINCLDPDSNTIVTLSN